MVDTPLHLMGDVYIYFTQSCYIFYSMLNKEQLKLGSKDTFANVAFLLGEQMSEFNIGFLLAYVCFVGFLTPSSTTRVYRGGSQDRASDNFTCCHT